MAQSFQSILDIHLTPWCPKLRQPPNYAMMSQIAPLRQIAPFRQILILTPRLRHSIRHDAQNCAMVSPIAPLRHFGKYSFWHPDCVIRFAMMPQITPSILRHCPTLRQCPKCSKCWILHCAMMPKIAPCRICGNDHLVILIILIEIAVIR